MRHEQQRRGRRSSDYAVAKVDRDKKIVWIRDLDRGGLSVTNDAENVVSELNAEYPGYRVIYQDSMLNWDELQHESGVFTGFAPARDLAL